jgi:uncharacterized membrane protein
MRAWFICVAYVAASLALGFTLPRLEYTFFPRSFDAIAVSSAQQFLGSVSAGMITLTGVVFSVGFVIVQVAGSAYSPRLAGWFSRDPIMFHALGTFMATFIYALATLWQVDHGGNGYVPVYSTYIVLLLLVSSMIALVLLIVSVGKLHITNTLDMVALTGRKAIARTMPQLETPPGVDGEPPVRVAPLVSSTPEQIGYYHGIPKVVLAIDRELLLGAALSNGSLVRLTFGIGDTLTEGMPIYRVYGATSVIPEESVLRALKLGRERDPSLDPMYTIRILVDIAIRALSPAVNDPSTAVEALDHIEDLLERIGRRRLDSGRVNDATGALRLVYPAATWDDYLSLSFDEIRMSGATQVQVLRRLRAALIALEEIGGVRGDAAHAYLVRLDDAIDRSSLDGSDRACAHHADRQGLGLSR